MSHIPEVDRPLPERQIIKLEPYPYQYATQALLDQWKKIPLKELPERRLTPLRELDLTAEEYGHVLVKDESDRSINQTGTVKDRLGESIVYMYKEFALRRLGEIESGSLAQETALITRPIPRCSDISAGNEAYAIAMASKQYNLPPLKVLIGTTTPQVRVQRLKELPIDLYSVSLAEWLSPKAILILTDNLHGYDLSSLPSMQRDKWVFFYGAFADEIFDNNPDDIFIPYGSAKAFDDLLTFQVTSFNENQHPSNPNLRVNIFGASPVDNPPSKADKLNASYRYPRFTDIDIRAMKQFQQATGPETGIYPFKEEYLEKAHRILNENGIAAEMSATAGLALYMQRIDEIRIQGEQPDFSRKTVIVSTGKGILED